ncbi:hypothetical protein [Sphingomonas sp. R1]|uniref:hypothetical protein n=1 Tax=Sphingomonas sp. R1 TaxID=399176 RepID=UPI0022241A8F|nr:hypothetical protein [Sphingomonas sp. R1]UYY76871.1 hypothetical protein OIM94_15390 [Sphingomonas sp. R1]
MPEPSIRIELLYSVNCGFVRCVDAGDRMRQIDPIVRLGLMMIVMLALLVIVIIFKSFLNHPR